jgi:hypothetical protein
MRDWGLLPWAWGSRQGGKKGALLLEWCYWPWVRCIGLRDISSVMQPKLDYLSISEKKSAGVGQGHMADSGKRLDCRCASDVLC